MKNNAESDEFCCLHICLFNNGKAIHFRTTLTPLRLLFLLLSNNLENILGKGEIAHQKQLFSYISHFRVVNTWD